MEKVASQAQFPGGWGYRGQGGTILMVYNRLKSLQVDVQVQRLATSGNQ